MPVTDLPIDILLLITPYLEARELLHFCSTCKALYPLFNADNLYWRNLTTSTFRLPNRPSDTRTGEFWFKLYKRLRTETKAFLWGSHQDIRQALPIEEQKADLFEPPAKGKPPGVISDFQIGGWSTTFLTSDGRLYTSGTVGNITFVRRRYQGPRPIDDDSDGDDDPSLYRPSRLKFFKDVTDQAKRDIRSVSVGRTTVVGLSDDRTIWLWTDRLDPGIEITAPSKDDNLRYSPSRVVAGWTHVSAYFPEYGIMVWQPPPARQDNPDTSMELLQYRVANSWPVPDDPDNLDGVLTSHILLEHVIIFTTASGHAYVSLYPENFAEASECLVGPDAVKLPLEDVTEVQGSFRSFAIFKKGEILIGKQGQVQNFLANGDPIPWHIIPALQNTGVIQLAFGDYHFHALHSDGTISSYGHSPSDGGALGLYASQGTSKTITKEPQLLPHGYINGRRVLFHPAQRQFAEKALSVPLVLTQPSTCGEFSEWMEQNVQNWHKWPEVEAINEDGLNPYFVLNIAAGGWSSGALVLVDEKVADKITQVAEEKKVLKQEINVRLMDGKLLKQGEGPILPWKATPPSFPYIHTRRVADSVFGVTGWQNTSQED